MTASFVSLPQLPTTTNPPHGGLMLVGNNTITAHAFREWCTTTPMATIVATSTTTTLDLAIARLWCVALTGITNVEVVADPASGFPQWWWLRTTGSGPLHVANQVTTVPATGVGWFGGCHLGNSWEWWSLRP